MHVHCSSQRSAGETFIGMHQKHTNRCEVSHSRYDSPKKGESWLHLYKISIQDALNLEDYLVDFYLFEAYSWMQQSQMTAIVSGFWIYCGCVQYQVVMCSYVTSTVTPRFCVEGVSWLGKWKSDGTIIADEMWGACVKCFSGVLWLATRMIIVWHRPICGHTSAAFEWIVRICTDTESTFGWHSSKCSSCLLWNA